MEYKFNEEEILLLVHRHINKTYEQHYADGKYQATDMIVDAGHGTDNGGFLAMNKESGELALYIPEDLDKPNIESKITTVRKSLKDENPPELCYHPVPDGVSGNMKLPRGCIYCRHKLECHKDTNEGKGLRIFQYAKGLSYLTKDIKEPKVKEITNEFKKSQENKKTRKATNA